MFFEIRYNVGLVLTNRAKKSQIFSLWPLCFLRNIHVFGCTFLVFYIPESSDPKYCARIACFRRLDGGDGTKRGPRSSSYHKRARKTVLFCREWSSREANWREARSSQSAILFLFFVSIERKTGRGTFKKRNISRTSRMTRNMTSCWARECSLADSASQITWVE